MHIQTKFLVYYILMLVTSILGIVFFNKKRNLQSLFILLPISLSTELLVEFLIYKGKNFYPLYHFYEIIDFFLLCLLFYKNRNFSGVGYLPVFFYISFLFFISIIYLLNPSISQYPSIHYSIESFLLITLSIRFLWTIEPQNSNTLIETGMFWVASGLILFHSGIFIVNGSFNYLIKGSPESLILKDWINMVFNYILYIFFIIGILCQKSSKT